MVGFCMRARKAELKEHKHIFTIFLSNFGLVEHCDLLQQATPHTNTSLLNLSEGSLFSLAPEHELPGLFTWWKWAINPETYKNNVTVEDHEVQSR